MGGRCRDCAGLNKSALFRVQAPLYARSALYGLGAALIGGYLWAMAGSAFGATGGLLGISSLLLLLLGYVVGEAVSRGARGRITKGLAAMAGSLTVVGVLAGRAITVLQVLPAGVPLALKLQVAAGIGIQEFLGNLFGLLFLVLAVVIATSRVR